MQRWGFDARNKPRFRCRYCKHSTTWKRPDVTKKHLQKLFVTWLLGKQELAFYCKKYGVTRQTLYNWLQPFWLQEPTPVRTSFRNEVLIIDGKYVERNASVLVACTTRKVVSWQFTQRENNATWLAFLSTLRHIPLAIVCDGQRGMLRAIAERYPRVIIQRCQFHVIHYCLLKLTKKPETKAAQELRCIIIKISQIKTKRQFSYWLGDYISWRKTYDLFLKERTYQTDNLTPTGRPKWHYTHGRLHAAHSHLKNALPNLFQYLRYPQIPNTTNFVEGAINSQMQEKLRFHRGLNLTKRRILIAYFLASKQR